MFNNTTKEIIEGNQKDTWKSEPLHEGVAMSEFPEKEGWDIELRDYIDKTLKPKKVGMKNLDREIIIDFVHRHIAQAKEEERKRLFETPREDFFKMPLEDFPLSELALFMKHVREEERARIKKLAEGNKKIIGHKLDCKMCSPNCGFNKALDELIKQL